MDDHGDHPYRWVAKRVPRRLLLVVATLGVGVAGFALWESLRGRGPSPLVTVFFAPFVALGAVTQIVRGIRALRAPTRPRFEGNGLWPAFIILTGGLFVVGFLSFVDDDPQTSAAIGSVMVAVGVVLAVAFLRYMAKPVRDDVDDA